MTDALPHSGDGERPTRAAARAAAESLAGRVKVGTAGWSYADWEGRVYPRSKPRGFHPLRHLARFVDLVEINSSFYAIPDAASTQRWAELVEDAPDFVFTAKLFQGLTHDPLERGDAFEQAARLQAFGRAFEPLRTSGRLRAVLAQFPYSFRAPMPGPRVAVPGAGPDRDPLRALDHLARLAGGLERALPGVARVLELRHASWFEPHTLAELGAQGWSVADIDLPAPPPGSRVRHPPARETRPAANPREHTGAGPATVRYLRLHGRNAAAWFDPRAERDDKYDYLYTEVEVQEMIARARRLAGERDETLVVTNNHFSGKALANALEIRAGLSGRRVAAPPELVAAFPHLRGSVEVLGQADLFDA